MTRWGREPGPSHLFLYCLFVEGPGSLPHRPSPSHLTTLGSKDERRWSEVGRQVNTAEEP